MTTVQITLPDDLAQRAKDVGLLSNEAIQKLLEDAVRREAGRQLLAIAEQLHSANIPPMTDEEIQAEVDAVRQARRERARRS